MNRSLTRVRFAPSPTGSLHLGNARTALFNWLVARQAGGSFVLRIEDTDIAREQAGSEQRILEDLRWLGLDCDEGLDVGGPFGPYRQSERLPLYRNAADQLLEQGSAYPCFCTEAELEVDRRSRQEAGEAPRYSGRCRSLSRERATERVASGEPCAIRFRAMPDAPLPAEATVSFQDRLRGRVVFPLAEMGDPVLLRRDGRPTYNFAVVVDDAAMKITLVVRGDDHLSNTPRQVLLFQALGHLPPEFAHLPMVRGPDGDRLSKRHGATSVAECRSRGYPPEGVLNALALLGWSPGHDRTILGVQEMIAEFDLNRVSRSPAIFDPVKLDWISAQHIQRMSDPTLAREAAQRLMEEQLLPEDALKRGEVWFQALARMLRGSIERFEQIPERCTVVFARGGRPANPEALSVLRQEGASLVIRTLATLADKEPPAGREQWRGLAEKIGSETGLKGRALFLPIRVALTGATTGPELDHLVPLISAGSRLFPDGIAAVSQRARRTLEECPE